MAQKCVGHTTAGTPCDAWAVRGASVCVAHGGAAPQVKAAAARNLERETAERAVATLGLPREIDPHTALLEEVWRAAGHVAWLQEVVAGLERQRVVQGVIKTVQLPDGGRRVEVGAAISTWVALYQGERDRLVRAAREAIHAGVAERQVRIAEGQAQMLARVISLVVTDLGHDLKDERVRGIMRLRVIEGGQAA